MVSKRMLTGYYSGTLMHENLPDDKDLGSKNRERGMSVSVEE